MKISLANIPVVCRQVSSPPLYYSELYIKYLQILSAIHIHNTNFVTVQTVASHSSSIRQQIIHLREKNIVGPTERSQHACMLQAHRVGPTFFDEDDVCGRIPELSYRPSELLFTSNPNSSGLNLGHTLSWVTITDAASLVPISQDSARLFP